MLAAVAECEKAIYFASEDLKADKNFILEAMAMNGYTLQYNPPVFIKNMPSDEKFAMETFNPTNKYDFENDCVRQALAHFEEPITKMM